MLSIHTVRVKRHDLKLLLLNNVGGKRERQGGETTEEETGNFPSLEVMEDLQ